MSQLNDLIFEKLVAFDGTVSDKQLAWLQSLGATANNVNDCWLELSTKDDVNEAQAAFYLAQGAAPAALNDMALDYWENIA